MLPTLSCGSPQWPFWNPRLSTGSSFNKSLVPSMRETRIPHPPSISPGQEDRFEESKARADEVTPETPILLSLDEGLMLTPPSIVDDCLQFHDLIRRVVDTLQIPMEEVRDQQQRLFDILQSATSFRVVLPINEALLDLAKMERQTPATIPPMCRRVDKNCDVSQKDCDFFVFPSPPTPSWWIL